MKVDLTKVIKDLDGKEVERDGKPVLVKDLVVQALTVMDAMDKSVSGEARYTRYKLATLIADSEENVELKVEDIAQIKELVGQIFLPVIVGRIYDALEGIA